MRRTEDSDGWDKFGRSCTWWREFAGRFGGVLRIWRRHMMRYGRLLSGALRKSHRQTGARSTRDKIARPSGPSDRQCHGGLESKATTRHVSGNNQWESMRSQSLIGGSTELRVEYQWRTASPADCLGTTQASCDSHREETAPIGVQELFCLFDRRLRRYLGLGHR